MAERRALEGLKIAIETETSSAHFYRLAADRTSDHQAREIFLNLVRDEEMHLS